MINSPAEENQPESTDRSPSLAKGPHMFGGEKNETEKLFPLSVKDDLGSFLEEEYEDLGDQGMSRKYGSRFDGGQVVPELDNSPLFDPTDMAGSEPLSSSIPSSPDALFEASSFLREVESGAATVGGPEFGKMVDGLLALSTAEVHGEAPDKVATLARAAKAAVDTWNDAKVNPRKVTRE